MGLHPKSHLQGRMWWEEDGGGGALKEKAKKVGVAAEEGGVETKLGRKERCQWEVSARSRGGS